MIMVARGISAVGVILTVAFVIGRSELLLNIDVFWLTAGGLLLSLWNYNVRDKIRGASAFLDNFEGTIHANDLKQKRSRLRRHQEDGVIEGLIIAAMGSLLGAAGQIFLIIVSDPARC